MISQERLHRQTRARHLYIQITCRDNTINTVIECTLIGSNDSNKTAYKFFKSLIFFKNIYRFYTTLLSTAGRYNI